MHASTPMRTKTAWYNRCRRYSHGTPGAAVWPLAARVVQGDPISKQRAAQWLLVCERAGELVLLRTAGQGDRSTVWFVSCTYYLALLHLVMQARMLNLMLMQTFEKLFDYTSSTMNYGHWWVLWHKVFAVLYLYPSPKPLVVETMPSP
jgi:hypothetical protein